MMESNAINPADRTTQPQIFSWSPSIRRHSGKEKIRNDVKQNEIRICKKRGKKFTVSFREFECLPYIATQPITRFMLLFCMLPEFTRIHIRRENSGSDEVKIDCLSDKLGMISVVWVLNKF
jgi:hypothetical protein